MGTLADERATREELARRYHTFKSWAGQADIGYSDTSHLAAGRTEDSGSVIIGFDSQFEDKVSIDGSGIQAETTNVESAVHQPWLGHAEQYRAWRRMHAAAAAR